MTSLPVSQLPKRKALTFEKRITYELSYEMTFEKFKEEDMEQLSHETDEMFHARCVTVWDKLCEDTDEDGILDLGWDNIKGERENDVDEGIYDFIVSAVGEEIATAKDEADDVKDEGLKFKNCKWCGIDRQVKDMHKYKDELLCHRCYEEVEEEDDGINRGENCDCADNRCPYCSEKRRRG